MTAFPSIVISAFITLACTANNAPSTQYELTSDRYEWLAYPTCPNTECFPSIFEYCKAASIGKLFDEYVTILGFEYEGRMGSESGNTLLKVALNEDTTSIYCVGPFVRRHLLSLMNSQNATVEKKGITIDLLSILEKSELHKAVNQYPFWPTSYHMGIKKQRREFFESLPCNTKLEQPMVFKNNEHRGTGIIFLDDTDLMRQLFLTDEDLKFALRNSKKELFPNCNANKPVQRLSVRDIQRLGFMQKDIDAVGHRVKGNNLIVQEFIDDTLLINGHKFGLRVFIVVLSMNPFVVLFSEGYASINLEVYDPSNIKKANVLSNREVSSKYKNTQNEEEEEWNWSFDQLGEYLCGREDVDFGINHVRDALVTATNLTLNAVVRDDGKFSKSTMKKMKKYVPLGIEQGVLDAKKDSNYMWLAVDYLLTEKGEVKLMEFNLHPGTRFVDHCSWTNWEDPRYADWQCQMGRQITKEIVDVSLQMAYRKKAYLPAMKKKELEEMIDFHQVLIYRKF